jgi:hypothetical protein
MNFFTEKTTWTNLELIPLKLCIASAYILVGAYFHSFVHAWYIPILILFAISVVYSLYLWIKKLKAEN